MCHCHWPLSAVSGAARLLGDAVCNTYLLLDAALDARNLAANTGTTGTLLEDVNIELPLLAVAGAARLLLANVGAIELLLAATLDDWVPVAFTGAAGALVSTVGVVELLLVVI